MYLRIDTYILPINQIIVNFFTIRISGRKAPIILSPKIPVQIPVIQLPFILDTTCACQAWVNNFIIIFIMTVKCI